VPTEGRKASTKPFHYLDIYRASATDRIRIIKEGIPAANAKRMIGDLHFDQGTFFKALNLKTATVNRKAANDEALSPEESERVMGVAKLVGQVQAMVEESGNADGFDAPKWLSGWLREPLPALGGQRPVDLIDTMEGQAMVAQALGQVQSGAYA
jgi:putative toxin-antitoxin system antitoxin component (TIGR02293 family)